MRKLTCIFFLVCGMFLLPLPASAQKPFFWIAPNWYEVGVTFPKSAPVGQITLDCAADNFTNSVDWGDQTSTQLNSPGAAYQVTYHGAKVTLVGPGTFNLYASADKTFVAEAIAYPLTPRLFSTIHCLDGTEEHWLTTSTLHVKPRTPLKEINLSASSNWLAAGESLDVKAGSAFKVRIIARERATLAKIHVDLAWTDSAQALVSPPASVDVPLDFFEVSFVVQTAKTTKRQTILLRASTAGSPLQATINVVP